MTKYSQAFCPELDRIITAHELWTLMMGPQPIKKALTFRCAKEGCDARLIVQHVPYYKVSFKASRGTKHQSGCRHLKTCDRRRKEYRDLIKHKQQDKPNFCSLPLISGSDLTLSKDRVEFHLTATPCLKRAS